MTATIDSSSIVVATDGSDDARRAVGWAAEQAHLEQRPLAVVTVVGTSVGTAGIPSIVWPDMGAAYAYQPQEMLEYGRTIVDEALALAHHLRPELHATASVLQGDARRVLVDLGAHVHQVVLGSRGRGAFRSKFLGSVSAAVSRDAVCPVVVCRPHSRGAAPSRGVLVGADGTAESGPVLEFAFAQASLLQLPLTVMHCQWQDEPTAQGEEIVLRRDLHFRLLEDSIAGISPKFPDVPVNLQLKRGLAEECLSENSAAWNLVVVGRHPVDTLFQLITGAVATVVVERADTTVAVVPQSKPSPRN